MSLPSPQAVLEPRLAWALWKGLEELSDLLWNRYGDDFLQLAEEEDLEAKASEDDLEVPF